VPSKYQAHGFITNSLYFVAPGTEPLVSQTKPSVAYHQQLYSFGSKAPPLPRQFQMFAHTIKSDKAQPPNNISLQGKQINPASAELSKQASKQSFTLAANDAPHFHPLNLPNIQKDRLKPSASSIKDIGSTNPPLNPSSQQNSPSSSSPARQPARTSSPPTS